MSGNKLAATTFAGVAREMLRAALITAVLGSALYAQAPAATAPSQQPPSQKVWPEEPLRGWNLSAYVPGAKSCFLCEEDFKKFKAWNVNLVHVMMCADPSSPATVAPPATDSMAPYKNNVEGLRIALALGEKYHIYIIPEVSIAGQKRDSLGREISQDTHCYPELIAFWEYIAKNFGANPWLLAYDLVGEPHTATDDSYWHSTMLPELLKRIRAIDQNTYVMVQPAPWALPDQAFPPTLVAVKDPKVVYSFHFYYPMGYTHQGVNATYPAPQTYPGMLRIFGEGSALSLWNKAALEASMKNAIVFQQKYHVKMFVGEFSVVRWAPNAAGWLSDVLDIFEKHHWSWAYHCYGDWNGWNPTFAADAPGSCAIADGGVLTDRMKILIKAWAKNEKF